MSLQMHSTAEKPKRFQPVSHEEREKVRLYYPMNGGELTAELLGRPLDTVRHIAYREGLRLTPEARAEVQRRNQLRRWLTTETDETARFEERVMPIPEAGCWLWTGMTLTNAAGVTHPVFKLHNITRRAAIWALARFRRIYLTPWQRTRPTCGLSLCVNPWHREVVIRRRR